MLFAGLFSEFEWKLILFKYICWKLFRKRSKLWLQFYLFRPKITLNGMRIIFLFVFVFSFRVTIRKPLKILLNGFSQGNFWKPIWLKRTFSWIHCSHTSPCKYVHVYLYAHTVNCTKNAKRFARKGLNNWDTMREIGSSLKSSWYIHYFLCVIAENLA